MIYDIIYIYIIYYVINHVSKSKRHLQFFVKVNTFQLGNYPTLPNVFNVDTFSQTKDGFFPNKKLFCICSFFFLQEPSESVVVPHNYSCELLPEQTDPEEVDSKAGYGKGMMGTGSKHKMVGIRRKSSGCS